MISIIYVYYNSFNVIINSIKSVLNSNLNIPYEIIIVVNRSNDSDIILLKKLNDKIIIIDNPENLGFGQANNIGANISKGKYILFLNPDTILYPDVLNEMYKTMENKLHIGGSICKLVDQNGKIQKTTMRLNFDIVYILINLYFIHKIPIINRLFSGYYFRESDYSKIQYPSTISGAFMMIRRTIFTEVEGFDENFFMYGEDNDLSMRINKISKLYYNPKVKTIHLGASSLGKRMSKEKLLMMYKSMFYLIEKHYNIRTLMVLKILFKLNAILLLPLAYTIKDDNLKTFIINRSKLFYSMPLRGNGV